MDRWTIQIKYRLEGVSSEEADGAVKALRAEGHTAHHSVDSLVVSCEQIRVERSDELASAAVGAAGDQSRWTARP